MESDAGDPDQELTTFCKGWAAMDPDLHGRLAARPQLRRALGIGDLDRSSANLRAAMLAGVLRRMEGESNELRRALLVSMNLDPAISHHNLGVRMELLANELYTSVTKVRQMKEAAIHQLVQEATTSPLRLVASPGDLGYRVAEYHASLSLGRRHSVSRQWRKIVATSDELDVIYGQFGLPSPPDGVHPDDRSSFRITEGGELGGLRRTPGNVIEFGVHPPSPLQYGQVHLYGFDYQFPVDQPLGPRFVVVPRVDMEAVFKTLYFRDRRPRAVWLIDGVVQKELDSGLPIGKALTIGESGEVHAAFYQVRRGLAYGIGWLM